MKILYVSGMADPLKSILCGKLEDEITHLPGFFHPWRKLVSRGHQVDFIVASNFDGEFDIKVNWFDEVRIYKNIYDPYSERPWYGRIFRRVKRFIKLVYFTNKAIKENEYDFIYCWAFYEGLAGNIVANFHSVPCGMRAMGTMLFNDFKKYGAIGTAIRKPIEFLAFRLKKNFFLITNDGTNGDLVHQKWKPKNKNYDFYFWKTGVDIKGVKELKSRTSLPSHKYLFFAARFDNWKRQDRIVEILHKLHCNNIKIHLYFAGHVTSNKYYVEITEIVKKYNLAEYVHFLGAIKQDCVRLYAYNAIANPLMYDVSNLGNIFFEIFSTGAIVIGINDGSLDEYIINGVNGFVVDNEDEACVIIEKLLREKDSITSIRESAIKCSKEKLRTVDERFDMEIELIENTVRTSKIHSFEA